MSQNTLNDWEDHYRRIENFGSLFSDHFRLRFKSKLSDEDRLRLKATTRVIEGKVSL